MEKKQNMQDDSSLQDGFPLDEEKTEDIAEQIQNLVEQDNHLTAIELFSQLRPGDQGKVLEDLPLATQQEMLTTLPPEEAAEILEHLEPEDVAKVSEGMDSSVLSDILDEADSDVTADILRQLPEERAQDVLGAWVTSNP
ncbi:magnesium transporter MgtE N-terminal domain-containing protein [Chloroflexota bacterium]